MSTFEKYLDLCIWQISILSYGQIKLELPVIFQNPSWVKHNGSCLPRSRPPNQLVVVMQGCGHTVTGSVGQDTLERWVR